MTTKSKKAAKPMKSVKRPVKPARKIIVKAPAKRRAAKPVAQRVAKPVARAVAKPAARTLAKPVARAVAKPIARPVAKPIVRPAEKPIIRAVAKPVLIRELPRPSVRPKTKIRQTRVRAAAHVPAVDAHGRRALRGVLSGQQFLYMKAPGIEHAFEVGDTVEVFCDHERSNERVRGWIKGIVVQVDNKMVAVQFRSNVFLTDGWMVPDRILWYPVASDQIREATFAHKGSHKEIPDY